MNCFHCGGYVAQDYDPIGGVSLKCWNCGRSPYTVTVPAPSQVERRANRIADDPPPVPKPRPHRPLPPMQTRDALVVGQEMKQLHEQQFPKLVLGDTRRGRTFPRQRR